MKNLNKLTLFLFITSILFVACKKDDLDFNPDNNATLVNGSISGLVTNQNGQALADVLITVGTAQKLTDINGYFSFKNIEISTRGSLVTSEREGYFYNAKFVSSRANKRNFTKIRMIEKVLSGTISSTSGGSVSTNGGATIDLPANGIEEPGGAAYTGTVNVYATWLDPTAVDLYQRMPGDLRATNASEEQVQLTTYGMIGVELEGTAGEALNLAEGHSATINLPVPQALLSNAPATIPLWHFDEASGYWIEDGEATLQGDKYVGQVSHFSFWNCDEPNSFIWLDGSIIDQSGAGVEGLVVTLTETSSGAVRYGVTDEDGVFEGYVPNNQELTLISHDDCSVEIVTDQIGPFTNDSSLPPYQQNGTITNFVTISGKLVDCDNNPVANGYFKVSYGVFHILETDANGNFSGTINTCNFGTVEGTGYDLGDYIKSSTETYNVNGVGQIELGEIIACNELIEYVKYSIDDDDFTIARPYTEFVNPSSGEFRINALRNNNSAGEIVFTIGFNATTVGTYTPFHTVITGLTQDLNYSLICDQSNLNGAPDCSSIDINITTFEDVGGYIIGTLNGTLSDSETGISYPVSVEFRLIIDQ